MNNMTPFQKLSTVIGGLLGAVILLILSMLQKLDGIPGYQYVLNGDYSIVFGFLLAAAVGALVCSILGALIGHAIEENLSNRRYKRYQAALDQAREDIHGLYLEELFMRSEDHLSTGKKDFDPQIAEESALQVIKILISRYGLNVEDANTLLAQYLKQQNREFDLKKAQEDLPDLFEKTLLNITSEKISSASPIIQHEILDITTQQVNEKLNSQFKLAPLVISDLVEKYIGERKK